MTWQRRQSQQQPDTQYESEGGGDTDVPASQLADKDSLFIHCNGLHVHYKQAYPAKVGHHLQAWWSSYLCTTAPACRGAVS